MGEIIASEANPLVSVVVPTFKRPDRLPDALDSILSQSYKNLEIIVVNDNVLCSDYDVGTESIISVYRKMDSRVRAVHTSGQVGGGRARNIACKEALGEYLAFLDDDDVFLPDKIETQLAFMQSGGYEMSWQDIAWYSERGRLVESRRLDHCQDFSKEGLLRAHLLIPISPTAIYMLKRSLFERTDGFGEVATGQDWWLMLRCIEAGARIGYMPGVHVHQRLHDGERLSLGENKIVGEEARHDAVRTYYPQLPEKDVRYIEFRHNAVLAFSSIRSGALAKGALFAFKALACSPVAFFSEGLKFIRSGKKDRF
ncbi:glycosyltransferase family 2 protein [Adlercreutzia faecimuris]|uniref:Glycosyltransferase n=1 Tax=Adlercreutzia faecimuris TaxID=2897341 RepID=A0ABS9WIV8_9ACTN|nr:glycosyltransferase family 2 protein [Adlercreutzia sp. JBNU-10]MCI2242813.1 glycosyltransferase [Adlercreutzia sp. JBNU-10]